MAFQVFLYLVSFTLLSLSIGVNGWRCAKYENYFSQQPDYIDCLWDCCGNSFNRHCCAPIGIIVGCCIVGAVVVAALTVLLLCWWQRRRAKQAHGPRLFHNQRHSHYPVAPSSVTRPAPIQAYSGPDYDQGFKPPLSDDDEYGQPGGPGYRTGAQQGYRPPPRSEKPPVNEYYDRPPQGYKPPPRSEKPSLNEYQDMPPQGSRLAIPAAGFHKRPPASDRLESVSLDSHTGERAVDI